MRYPISIALGVLMALLLFYVMHSLIAGGEGFSPGDAGGKVVDFVRVKPEEITQTKDRRVPKKPPPPKDPPHHHRMVAEVLSFCGQAREQPIIGGHKLGPVFGRDHPQVADHPAALLVLPIIRQPDKGAPPAEVGKKWKGPAGQRAEVPLAKFVALEFDQHLPLGCLRPQPGSLGRLICLPEMP